jgi:hypothetical protein
MVMTRPESVPQAIWDTLTSEAQACFAAVIGRLKQQIADFEARLNQNWTSSSRTPCTDPPGLKRKPPASCGPLSPCVPAGAFGPRLQATLGLLAGGYRLSKRQVHRLARDLLGLRIAVGMIAKLERQSAAALEARVQRLRGSVIEAPVVQIDETSWRQDFKKAWLWVRTTGRATVFTIAETRRASVAWTLLGTEHPQVVLALSRGERYACGLTEGTCTELRKVEPGFWTFVRLAGVEPSNNMAAHALRHIVIWRRVSGGTDSRAGSRFVERMLTAVATCRQQGRDVLDYLTSCFEALLAVQDIPSLLLPE